MTGKATSNDPVIRSSGHPKALIVGAGLAGCCAAQALARRGWEVTLLERREAPARETSANPAAILFPMTALQWNTATRLYLTGYSYAQSFLRQYPSIQGDFCGMVQCPKRPGEAERLERIPEALGLHPSVVSYVDQEQASLLSGLALGEGGLWFPGSGWFNLQQLCQALLSQGTITARFGVDIAVLERRSGEWVAQSADGEEFAAPVVIHANAGGLTRFLPITLKTLRGQITSLPETPATGALKTVLCFGGYLTPAHDGRHHLGATHDRDRQDVAVDDTGHTENLRKLSACCPGLTLPAANELKGWAGLRSYSPDRLPLIGQAGEGLYVTAAHGSRGLLTCPLGGELLASLLQNEPLPLEQPLVDAVNPLRFTNVPV